MDNFNDDGDYDNNDNVTGSSQQPNHPYGNPYLIAVAVVGTIYAENYLNKQPCRTSSLTGHQRILELQHGNATTIYENFRMDRDTNYELQSGKKVGAQQQVAIFLYIVGQHANNRNAQERFQLSGETILKYFHSVLKACVKMPVD
ncbi:hypothetical protein ACSBR2_036152 [Camellia fascicularis]